MTWTLVSQDTATNTSVVNVKVVWSVAETYGLSSGSAKTVTVNCLGATGTASADPSISSGASKTIFNKDLTVSHNADGTKSGTITVNWPISVTLNSGSTIGPLNISCNATLPTIPRASTVSFSSSSMTAGTAYTINISRASSSFTHKLSYSFGSGSGLTTGLGASNGVGTSTSFTPPTSLFQNYMTNASSGTLKITCQTYNGSTLVGSKTASATLSLSGNAPTVSFTTEDPYGYLTTYGGYVLGKSKITITGTESAKLGASISSRTITANGTTYNSNPATTDYISSTSNTTIKYTVKDSRGLSGSASSTITILDYKNPNISKFTVERCTSSGTVDSEGTWLKITYSTSVSPLNNKNSVSFRLSFTGTAAGSDEVTVSEAVPLSIGYSTSNATYLYNAGDNTTSFIVSARLSDDFTVDTASDTARGTMYGLLSSDHLGTVLSACKTYASSSANILPKTGGTISGNLTTNNAALYPKYWYLGGKNYSDLEKNIYFNNSGSGTYTHQCKIYGGSGTSAIGAGFFDSVISKRLLSYNASLQYCYTNLPYQHHAITVTGTPSLTATSTASKVTLGTVVGNSGGDTLIKASNGGIYINSDTVHYVEVSGQVCYSDVGTTNTYVTAYIYKNSSNVETFHKISNNDNTNYTSVNFCNYIMPVTKGDYIYLYTSASSGSGTVESSTSNRNLLTVKVVG